MSSSKSDNHDSEKLVLIRKLDLEKQALIRKLDLHLLPILSYVFQRSYKKPGEILSFSIASSISARISTAQILRMQN